MPQTTKWIALTILLLGGAVAAYQLQVTTASEPPQLPPPKIEYVTDLKPNTVATSPAQAAPVTASPEAIAQELQILDGKWRAAVLQGGGWFHTLTRFTSDPAFSAGALPSGQVLPGNGWGEQWFQLDATGQLITSVNVMKDEQGAIVQQSVLQNGELRNLTLNEVHTIGKVKLQFGDRIAEQVVNAEQTTTQVQRSEYVAENGKTTLTISFRDAFASPINLTGTNEPVIASVTRSFFDPGTGAYLGTDTIWVSESGLEIVTSRVEIVTFERITTPPQTVLDLLK